MIKKYQAAFVTALLLITPLAASAQTATQPTTSRSLIAVLTQLVQILEQELQQLIAAQRGSTTPTTQPSTPSNSATLTASPSSGAASLAVTFYLSGQGPGRTMALDFGDGTNAVAVNAVCTNSSCAQFVLGTHIYSSSGTYTATLTENAMVQGIITIGTATITVTGSNSAQPSATIDQSSLSTIYNYYQTIRGTALGLGYVGISITGVGLVYNSPVIEVSSAYYGSVWSIPIPATLQSGIYMVAVYGYTGSTGGTKISTTPLVSGTLSVNASE